MADEAEVIDQSKAIHVWFTLECDAFYNEPPWTANWVYCNERGRITTYLYERHSTPLGAVRALLARMS
jgi:hypothetical protein